MELNPSLVE
jgi:hypothetical protein